MTASFYFQANTLQTKQNVKDYNTSLICIYHILICEASISNITPSDYEICDGKHTPTTNQIFCHKSQINATHNNSFKTRQKHRILYQLMQKKFPSSTKKSCHAYWPLLGLYLFEGVFYAIYTIKSQSSTVIQTCYLWHSHNKQGLSPFIETIAQNYHKVWMECDLFWICSS